jgi:hypothetical protein
MTLRKGEDTLIWKRKLWIALCGELALEEALDLSQDRLLNEWRSEEISACFSSSFWLEDRSSRLPSLLVTTFQTTQYHIIKYVIMERKGDRRGIYFFSVGRSDWRRPLGKLSCRWENNFNPLNAELNPICYLLPLLAHHFLHISRIRVKLLTFRLLMSYIYIYIYIWSAYSWCF